MAPAACSGKQFQCVSGQSAVHVNIHRMHASDLKPQGPSGFLTGLKSSGSQRVVVWCVPQVRLACAAGAGAAGPAGRGLRLAVRAASGRMCWPKPCGHPEAHARLQSCHKPCLQACARPQPRALPARGRADSPARSGAAAARACARWSRAGYSTDPCPGAGARDGTLADGARLPSACAAAGHGGHALRRASGRGSATFGAIALARVKRTRRADPACPSAGCRPIYCGARLCVRQAAGTGKLARKRCRACANLPAGQHTRECCFACASLPGG